MPKDTVTDVNNNGKPDLNDADQPGADQPTITQTPANVDNAGHVTTPAKTVITPGENNDQMTITYYPEDTAKDADHGQEVDNGAIAGSPETLKVVKGKDGQWQPEGATVEELADKGIAVDPDTGAGTFEPNAILGGTEIKAEGTVAGSKPATVTATADIDTPAHDQWYTVSLSEFQGDANDEFANGITADYLVNKTPKFNEEDASKGDVLIDGSSDFTEELHVEFTDKDGKDQSLTLKRMSDKDGQTGVGRPAELADYKADWVVVNDDGTVNAEATLQYFRASNDNSQSNRFVLKGDNLNDGQEVSVWATNHLGIDKPANTGNWETYQPVTADKTPTADAPDVQAIDNGAATVKPGDDNTTLTVTATDEKGETHTGTFEKQDDGSWACEDFWDKGLTGENASSDENNLWVDLVKELNEKGEFTIPGQYLQDDSEVTAVGTNADKLSADDSDTVGVNAAVTAITGIAGDDFEIGLSDIDDGKVTITGTTKATTGGETVTLTVDGKEIGTATVNADGTFSAEVNVGDLTNVSDADRKVTASIEGAGKIEAYTVEENAPSSNSFSDTIFENSSNGYGSQDHIKFTNLDDHVVLTHPNSSGGLGIQNSNTIIEALDGNDYLEIQGSNGVPGILGYINNNYLGTTGDKYIQVNMGSGDDELVVTGAGGGSNVKYDGAAIWESQVDMGSGDDVVNVGGAIKATTNKLLDTYVDGGAGYDTLNITGGGVTQSMATVNPTTGATTNTNFIKGFEVIDLGDNGNSLTNVTWTAIQNNNAEQALRILSDNGMGSDASVGLDSTWSQVGTETADGVTYDVYHSSSNTANNDNLDIWIQQGIQII